MEYSIISEKGEVIIPKWILEKHKIKTGSKVVFSEENEKIIMQVMNKEYFQRFAGILKGGNNMKDILAEKK
jgi:bifunctional DNA-binding transcriptional regulator/antitoxin component of YhaV-PrlF toxin-antitoxin module